MTVRLQVLLILFLILSFILTVRQISRKKLDFKFGIGWLFLIIVLMILTIWPGLLLWMTHLVGIATPINFLLILGILLLVLIVFSLTKSVNQLQQKVTRMAQELAILKDEEKRG